ncbi:MAG: histidine--tRNA ligase [Pseudomonadota bacterium]|nr:histidine--tRNA ligase [Pseudomonadota bacterium]|tara:strand:- start:8801 stop:10084 length:1284 start_codon:yes stop_codon:yes gene_type:complete
MNTKNIQSIKGFKDILPSEVKYYNFVEKIVSEVAHQYAINELRLPLVERSELFFKSIGDSTDIVNKEMYDFIDKNGESICLRPEGTASIVRAVIEHNLVYDRGLKKKKYMYYGPMFRHEKPQKGRYRQFNQFGVEYFGYADTNSDLELIILGNNIFERLGLAGYNLHINSLGNTLDKKKYSDIIVQYFEPIKDTLDEYQLKTLVNNPLRLLDSKKDNIKNILNDLPKMRETLSDQSKFRFETLLKKLDNLGVTYSIDNSIVRGLDYYNDTVFEWRDNSLGSQNAICAGGRYDSLVENTGGESVPAIGFAIGIERIIELIKSQNVTCDNEKPTIPIMSTLSETETYCIELASILRKKYPNTRFLTTDSSASLSSQTKNALKINDYFIILLTDKNKEDKSITVKMKENKMNDMILTTNELIEFMDKSYE